MGRIIGNFLRSAAKNNRIFELIRCRPTLNDMYVYLLFEIKAVKSDYNFTRDKVSLAVLLNYAVLSVALIGFDETYPVWAADSPKLGT